MDNIKINLTILLPGRSLWSAGNSAKQVINISNTAYNAMLEECPSSMKNFIFSKLSKKKKIEAHLNDIATTLNGKVADFKIFED